MWEETQKRENYRNHSVKCVVWTHGKSAQDITSFKFQCNEVLGLKKSTFE